MTSAAALATLSKENAGGSMGEETRQQRQRRLQRQQQQALTETQHQRGAELPHRQDQSHHNATPGWAKKQAASAGQ
jgi:hypothetical protein